MAVGVEGKGGGEAGGEAGGEGEGEGDGEGENEGEGEGEGEVSMTRGSQAVRLPMLASRHLYE